MSSDAVRCLEALEETRNLRFSAAEFDPDAPRHQPSILLLTQNMGGIETAVSEEEDELGSPSTDNNASFLSAASRMTAHDRHDINVEGVVSDDVKKQTWEFLADLRAWLHQAAFAVAQGVSLPARSAAAKASQSEVGHPSGEAVVRRDRRVPTTPHATSAANYAISATPPQLDVIVLHLQEIGGKYANTAFTNFFSEQVRLHLLPEAGWCSGLLIEKPGDASTFTAIGTVVFVSPRLRPITSMLVLPHRTYIPVADDPASYGGTGTRLFHSAKFSNAGNSRKGFVFVSLRLGTTLLHCCNVHLFNDVSNRVALDASPSVYVRHRAEAMLEAVAECLTLVGKDDPMFFFGDMNVRLDGKALAAYAKTVLHVDLVAETKALHAPDSFWTLFGDPARVKDVLESQFDLEPRQLMDRIANEAQMEMAEMPVHFFPTYLRLCEAYSRRWLTRDTGASTAFPQTPLPSLVAARTGQLYSHARLPAWCDRVFFNPAALELIAGGCGLPSRGTARGKKETDSAAVSAADAVTRANTHYVYDALHLCHTDHNGVFLLF